VPHLHHGCFQHIMASSKTSKASPNANVIWQAPGNLPVKMFVSPEGMYPKTTAQRSIGFKIENDLKDLYTGLNAKARNVYKKNKKELGFKTPFQGAAKGEWMNLKWNNCPVTILHDAGDKVGLGPKGPSEAFFKTREEDGISAWNVVELTVAVDAYPGKEGVYPAGISYKMKGITVMAEDCDPKPEKSVKKVAKKRKVAKVEVLSDEECAMALDAVEKK